MRRAHPLVEQDCKIRNTLRRLALPAFAVFLVASCSDKPSPASDSVVANDALVLQGGMIVNPESAEVSGPTDILIENARIVSIGPASADERERAKVLDVRGRYLLPGFVEMHAHLLLHPWLPDGEIARQYDREGSLRMLSLLLAHGITTVRDPGSPTEAALFLREQIRGRKVVGPTLYTAGRILSAVPFPYEPYAEVKTADDVRREIRWQADSGVDFIKVYSSFSPELLKVAIDAAHEHRLRIVGHLGRTSWTRAAELGLDGFEHPSDWHREHLPQDAAKARRTGLAARIDWLESVDPGGPEVARMAKTLAERDAFVIPTLITVHSKFFGNQSAYRDPPERGLVPDVFWAGWEKGSFTAAWTETEYAPARAAYPKITQLVRTLFDSGVLLAVGTDTPTPWTIPGVSFHQELALLKEMGVSNADVLRMATVNGARALGIDDRTGRIAQGYEADIIVLRENPLEDLSHARAIELVLSDGRALSPEALLSEGR